jgi:PBP1b-binding outer membrane lipoprotein LpoB
MKKVLIIAIIAIVGLSMTSCKGRNAKKAAEEPAAPVEQTIQQAADTVVRTVEEAIEDVSPETKIVIDQAK